MTADVRALVEQCLDNQPSRRPAVSNVSERMKRMNEVESEKCPCVNMNLMTWQQVDQTTKMLREATITAQAAKVQVTEVKFV